MFLLEATPSAQLTSRTSSKINPSKNAKSAKKDHPKASVAPSVGTGVDNNDDPDMSAFLRGRMDKRTYLLLREEYIARKRGIDLKNPPDPHIRMNAIRNMERQELQIYGKPIDGAVPKTARRVDPFAPPSLTTWTELGPSPIPNGQTEGTEVPVSGRVTAIAVHPTNPNIVYVGAAQGGVFRSLDGGATWTPLMDSALSLAVGAIAIAPSQPSTVYVGTGEANFSLDSFFGVGVYRIDNADTNPVLVGPLHQDGGGNDVFTQRAISQILVHPANPNTIFVSTSPGSAGRLGSFSSSPTYGVYRSTNAAGPVNSIFFTQIFDPGRSGIVTDIAMEPGNPNNLLAATESGYYRCTNALANSPAFTQTLNLQAITGKFAINKVGATVTVLAGSDNDGQGPGRAGAIRVSKDGGTTWSAPLASAAGFCGGQCFYDLVVTLKPDDAGTFFLGGQAGDLSLQKTTNGGVSFTSPIATLHGDTHAIVYAPSDFNVMYEGNDGGIWRSNDGGNSWTSRNTAGFSATQFESLALHPRDRNFMIGGTQDNGTIMMRSDGSWFRADFGDGGYALIDQNATGTTNVTMYHTYFNVAGFLIGFGRTLTGPCAVEGQWTFYGAFTGPIDPTVHCDGTSNAMNGIDIDTPVLFYAPMALGPGTPNPIYFATDRLYRSTDRGVTMTAVSPGTDIRIASISISPRNDNVRILVLSNAVWATTTGSFDNPVDFGRFVDQLGPSAIDPADQNTAYVAYDVYGNYLQEGQVWKTTDIGDAFPVWTDVGNGIPAVPVNCIVIDPIDHNSLYVGTDIGVYHSADGGVTWNPYGVGLPRVAVFDIGIQKSHRVLRVATHGRGIWEIGAATAITHFSVVAGVSATAGVPFSVTVTALDANNHLAPYTGTLHFTSSDAQAILPPDYDFVPGDGGIKTFNFTLGTAGPQTITVADSFDSAIFGMPALITVSPGPADHFNVVPAPAGVVAGNPINVTLTALDAFNNTAFAYTGTVHFTSGDPQAVLPPDSTLSNGVGTFPVTLKTAQPQNIIATDTVNRSIMGFSTSVTVTPAAANHFTWNVPLTASVGYNFLPTLRAFDNFNNLAASYTGAVQLSTTGAPTVTLPTPNPYTFTSGAGNSDNGVHTFTNGFQVTTGTPGNTFTITANDAGHSITATSPSISVTGDAPLTGAGRTIAMFRPSTPMVIASFIDTDTNEDGTNLAATINWGDGSSSPGTIVKAGSTFNVMGFHNYAKKNIYTVIVTMNDANGVAGNGSAAIATSTVRFFPINASH